MRNSKRTSTKKPSKKHRSKSSKSSKSSSKWLHENVYTNVLFTILRTKLQTYISVDENYYGTEMGVLKPLEGVKVIGSYNWCTAGRKSRPKIIIPGRADTLRNELPLTQLYDIKHERIVDENRHFYPEYPMEPLFRAVQYCTPDFDWENVDVVTDRNNLRKLLSFIEGNPEKSIRIDFQRVGNMLVLIRCDESDTITCDDYSLHFKRMYTENGLGQGKKTLL